ncbi:MAG TPA: DUF2975 domain-containing protein [Longimicrobiales bacterium]|nr:DUF2975 domain-containing protein [Longimicrobiales bacterium]
MPVHRSGQIVRGLARLVSFAYYTVLVLAAILLIGLPLAKLAAADNPDWVIGLTVPTTLSDSETTVLTRWGDGRLEVEDVRASLRLPVATLPWWLFGMLWLYVAVMAALMLSFLHHLCRIFQRVREGAPFEATNAHRLRLLGLIALAFALLEGVAAFVTSMAVRGSVIGDAIRVTTGLPIDGSVLFFGLVLLALAEVFRRGAELEEEQALTV